MEKNLVFETDRVNIWHYPDMKIMHTEFKKYTFGEEYREFLTKLADNIQKYKTKKLLSDDRNNKGIAQADQEWGRKTWFPRAKAEGWKYWAIVIPETAVGKMTMKRIINDVASEGIITEVFTDPKLAMEWLEKNN